MNIMSDEQIVADMVKRYRKWDARGTPDRIIMNKILVNLRPIICRAAIKEVVKWLNDNLTAFVPDGTWDNKRAVRADLKLLEGEWQAKLKEWGLEEAGAE